MVKLENEAVTPLKPKFYWRYANDIFNRYNKNVEYILFSRLNNYQNMKITIEINPTKFLDKQLNCVNGIYKMTVHKETTNSQYIGHLKYKTINNAM